MTIQRTLALGVLALSLAACKPADGLPRMQAKAPPPPPPVASVPIAPASPATQLAKAEPKCACPEPVKAAAPRKPRPARRAVHRRPAPKPHVQNAYARRVVEETYLAGGEAQQFGGEAQQFESVQVQGGGYYGARQSTARDYSVSRTAYRDADRSRAWIRVRCPDGQYRYEHR